MPKDADHKPPIAEELALRVAAPAGRRRRGEDWLSLKRLGLIAALLAAALMGAMYMLLRDNGSFARRRLAVPPQVQLDAAILSAQERLKENPQDISALAELGTLHFQKGKEYYPDAINELEEARELGALDARMFYCLGVMYQEVGLYPFALDEYRRFLRHYPDDKEVRMLEAKLLYKQGGYAEAVQEYERLKFHYPNDAVIEENLGLSLWGAKLTQRAVDSFKQLESMGGDQAARAQFYLGRVALEQGQPKEALEYFLKCQPSAAGPIIGIPPESILEETAEAYQKLGRLADAKASWERALALAPDDAKAKAALRDLGRKLVVPTPKTRKKSSKRR